MSNGADTKAVYRRYSYWMIVPVILPLMLTAIGALFFQPYWGPLTRLGGFLENDYGWNSAQETFEKPLFKKARNVSEYDHYYDVVVVGDSFSDDERKGWQNYFVAKTGFSVITLTHNMGIEDILASDIFQSNPPRYLIFESLEQFSLPRLVKLNSLKPLPMLPGKSFSSGSVESIPLTSIQTRFLRRSAIPPLGRKSFTRFEDRIDESMNYLRKAVERSFSRAPDSDELRAVWGSNREDTTFVLPLRKDAGSLFSSKQKGSMLVYSLDIGKTTDESAIKQAAHGAWQLKRAVEANGKTKVMFLIFPDKLSIYAPYLSDPTVAPPSVIPSMAQDYPSLLRLDKVFASAVATGVQDLYLPDDSHCGYEGYKLAAGKLLEAINDAKEQPVSMVHSSH